jgi:cephalosporin-C deacetylase-like acetyl esterase
MRKDVSFTSKGLRCSGWLYVPDDLKAGQKAPAIVMAHGFTGVKESILPDFAALFAKAGFATLVFDFRYFGESEGEPRSQVFPLEMVEDIRNAITWVSDQPEVDSQRIGIWGASFGGGLVLYAGTYDRRVKAVVSQVPYAPSPELRRAGDPQGWDEMTKTLLRDRVARYKTGVVNYMKVVATEGEPCVLPGKEAYEEYMALETPNWRNQVTLESLEKIREFDSAGMIHMMSPTALLLIVAEKDSFFPPNLVKAIYDRALEPKAMSVLPVKHFEIYGEPWLSKAAGLAIGWYEKHL